MAGLHATQVGPPGTPSEDPDRSVPPDGRTRWALPGPLCPDQGQGASESQARGRGPFTVLEQ